MSTYLKMAWRNLWRNKRRTIITISSVFFAVSLSLYMRSMQIGSYNKMIDNVVKMSTGELQIHAKGYWNDQTIDNSFEFNQKLVNTIESIVTISDYTPRISNFALASKDTQTKGVGVIGIRPIFEERITNLKSKIVAGEYLSSSSKGVLLAEGLADYLKIGVNDTIVLMGQGYHGNSALGLFRVEGVLKFPIPDLNNQIVYMELGECQEFYSAYNLISSVVVNLNNKKKLKTTINTLKSDLEPDKYEVLSWREMSQELVQMIEADDAQGKIMLAILYLVIAFGIFGTVLMMVAERRREFGVVIAVGMKKTHLVFVLLIEVFLISVLSLFIGVVVNAPFILMLHNDPPPMSPEMAKSMEAFGMEPIMPFAFQPDFFLNQAFAVFVIVLIAAAYPILKVFYIKVNDALKA